MDIQVLNRFSSRLAAGVVAFLTLVTVVMAVPASAAIPDSPTSVGVVGASSGVTVSWAPATANGSPITGYTVALDTLGAGSLPAAVTTGPGATSVNFPNLAAGTYDATVIAKSADGDSPAALSAEPDVTIAVPDAPTGVAVAASGADGVLVSWSASVANGSAVTGYVVNLVPSGGGVAPGAHSVGSAAGSTSFTGLAPGTYSATVVADSAAGSSVAGVSAAPAVTIAVPASPPDAPTGVAVAASGADGVLVSWSASVANGSAVTGYVVNLVPSGGGVAPGAHSVGSAAGSTSFTGLAPGTYSATVVADSAAGSSVAGVSAAPAVTIAVPASAPDAPAVTMTANGVDGVTINWTPGSDNGSTVTGFSVQLVGSNGGENRSSNVGLGISTKSFTGLAPGTYTASVVTVSSDQGNSPAGVSGSLVVTEPVTIPDPPTNVVAERTNNTITVNFTPPVGGGVSVPTGYRVILAPATASPSVKTLTAGATSTSFTTAVSGDYTVTVASINSAGLSVSVPSNMVEIRIDPTSPTNVTLSAEDDQVTVNWTATSSNTDGGQIDKYLVSFGGTTYEVDHPATTLVISGVSPGNYSATVVAVNTFDLSSGPATSNSIDVIVAPDAPTNVVATADVQTVTVTWGPPSALGGSDVVSYEVTLAGVSKTVAGSVHQAVFPNVELGDQFATVVATTAAGPGAAASSSTISVERAFHPFDAPQNFVDQLYRDILGRQADAGGRDYWTGKLANSEDQVPFLVNQFLDSAEFGPRRPIIRLYLAYFNRAPDKGGFDYWTGLYASKEISLRDASFLFSESKEFELTYGELTDAQFIVLVYNNVLGRRPDVGGFNYWLNQLSRGLVRADVMLSFSESPEFQTSSKDFADITMVYRGMMGRIPAASSAESEYAVWLPRLRGSDDIDDLILDVYNSEEYAERVTP